MHAQVCRVWGWDPAAFLEAEDDVLAMNLRTALAVSLARETPEELDDAAQHRELIERARQTRQLRGTLG